MSLEKERLNVREKILLILKDIINSSDFDLEKCLEYELDSITFMQFIVALEEEFDVEIPDGLLFYDGIETFENIIKFLQERGNKSDN